MTGAYAGLSAGGLGYWSCESRRYLAGMWSRFLEGSPAYEEGFSGGVDDFRGDGVEVVALSDAVDLGEQSVDV